MSDAAWESDGPSPITVHDVWESALEDVHSAKIQLESALAMAEKNKTGVANKNRHQRARSLLKECCILETELARAIK